jgi:DNA-binding NtrC family response regulator
VLKLASEMQSRVLIVDDDRDAVETLENVLSADGYACELAPDAATAIRSVDGLSCDVVVSDVVMQGMDGAPAPRPGQA